MTLHEKIESQKLKIKNETKELEKLQEERAIQEHKKYLEREREFKKAYPKADYLEIDGRVYISYSIWRRHIAPFRAAYPHKSYYPTLREFTEYRYLAQADGYAYYGYGNNAIDYPQQWINLLDELRQQAGKPRLTPQEERESLDKGFIVCYT